MRQVTGEGCQESCPGVEQNSWRMADLLESGLAEGIGDDVQVALLALHGSQDLGQLQALGWQLKAEAAKHGRLCLMPPQRPLHKLLSIGNDNFIVWDVHLQQVAIPEP